MRMKCGSIVTEFGELEDASWELSDDGMIDVYTDDGYWVLTISPENFFPLAAAIKEGHNERQKTET